MIRLNDKVIFHTTGCPKCRVLKMKLDKAGVRYEVNEDVDAMRALGMMSAPALSVNGELLNFAAACKWADDQKE